jgi:hypothetical protein
LKLDVLEIVEVKSKWMFLWYSVRNKIQNILICFLLTVIDKVCMLNRWIFD